MTREEEIKVKAVEAIKKRCEDDFYAFVKLFWQWANPKPKYDDNWHIEVICRHLERVYHGDIRDIIINVPPGTGKSRLISILFVCWCWLKDPSLCISCVSHGVPIITEFGHYILEVLRSPLYQAIQPNLKIPTNAAKTRILNGCGGEWFATTPHGPITGKHLDILMFDDLLEPENSDKKENEFVCHWLPNTYLSRASDLNTVRCVGVGQRIAEYDPAQWCIDAGWYHLNLPARYSDGPQLRVLPSGHTMILDEREKKGENIFPMRFPEATFDKLEKERPYIWAGQYQQTPGPDGGAIIKKEWLQNRWTTLPKAGVWAISVDATFNGKETSDFVVIQVWLKSGSGFYLVDQARGHWDFDDTVKELCKMIAKYPQARARLIEAKANGEAIITHLGKRIPGLVPVTPNGNKESRCNTVVPFFAAGNVFLPERDWTPGFVHELSMFPKGKYDDQVDAMSQVLCWLDERGATVTAPDEDMTAALLGLYPGPRESEVPVSSGYAAWRMRRAS